jgi:hypothetical protein
LRWPTSIGCSDFVSSISAAFKSGDCFISILKALQPPLELWFTSLATDPSPFVIQGRTFLSLYDAHFWDILTGNWPPSLLDQQGFSPLAEGTGCHRNLQLFLVDKG